VAKVNGGPVSTQLLAMDLKLVLEEFDRMLSDHRQTRRISRTRAG